MSQASIVFAMKVGVPSAENTEPMNVEADQQHHHHAGRSARCGKSRSLSTGQVSCPCAAVTSSAPTQPIAAPSVGVAQPVMIEPSVAMISAAGGISPKKNSRTT